MNQNINPQKYTVNNKTSSLELKSNISPKLKINYIAPLSVKSSVTINQFSLKFNNLPIIPSPNKEKEIYPKTNEIRAKNKHNTNLINLVSDKNNFKLESNSPEKDPKDNIKSNIKPSRRHSVHFLDSDIKRSNKACESKNILPKINKSLLSKSAIISQELSLDITKISSKPKSLCKDSSSVKDYCVFEEQNNSTRKYMEDYTKVIDKFAGNKNIGLFCIFDGHGGKETSSFLVDKLPEVIESNIRKLGTLKDAQLIENALINSFEEVDSMIGKSYWGDETGSTASVILTLKYTSKLVIYSANIGDSRSAYFNISKNEIIRLTYDHKATDSSEIQIVKANNGLIYNNRVEGQLAITRAFGDFNLKNNKKLISSVPYIKRLEIDITTAIKNSFIVMASDGVWDVLEDDDVFNLCKINCDDTNIIAEQILYKSLENESTDNISVIVIRL